MGGESFAGDYLKSESGWQPRENNGGSGNGMDIYSFTALPAGYKYYRNGMYYLEGIETHFWSSTEDDYTGYDYAYYLLITRSTNAYTAPSEKNYGYSVRCIQDN